MMTHTNKRSTLKSTLAIALSTLLVSGCAKYLSPKQMQARIIETTRSSIITTPRLSSLSKTVLLSSGLTQDDCMADFEGCLTDLRSAFFGDKVTKEALVLMAELHYAQALHLSEQAQCKPTLDRPPLNDYYTNAPIDADTQSKQKQAHQDCLMAYREALYQTIALSYGYLFFDDLTGEQTSHAIITDNDIRAQDLYHIATNALIQEIYKQDQGAFANAAITDHTISSARSGQTKVSTITSQERHHAKHIHLHLSDEQHILALKERGKDAISDLISIYDYRLADLQVNSSRAGLGVGFVSSLEDRHTALFSKEQQDKVQNRIHPMGHLLMTAIIQPKGTSLQELLTTHEFDVHFYNPYTTKDITILGKSYPLSASFSSTYATWLSENHLQRVSLLNMIAKKDHATLPELFMLSPYNPRQKVIIMIHGLASSPATWVNLTNNLLADPVLRDNYQVWQVFYATNLPILENRYQIHKLINQAFVSTDPHQTNPSSHDAILIGHSMGGIISRMLVSEDDLTKGLDALENMDAHIQDKAIKDTIDAAASHENLPTPTNRSKSITKLLSQTQHQELGDRFSLQPLPQVSTAIFISAPFRGTDYADRWFTRAARRAIQLPLNFTKGMTDTITSIGEKDNIENNLLGSLYLQNGADQLSDRSAFIKLTADIRIKDGIRYHTIMGDHQGLATTDAKDTVADRLSDGIVPYSSSHLAGANSETIITGRHNIHENPKTILQLRKILHEEIGTPNPASRDSSDDLDQANDNTQADDASQISPSTPLADDFMAEQPNHDDSP